MKIRNQPSPPKRKSIPFEVELDYLTKLSTIRGQCVDYLSRTTTYTGKEIEGLDDSMISVEARAGYYNDGVELYATFSLDESEADFSIRHDKFQIKLVEYNNWYDDNSAEIGKELKLRDNKRKAEEAERVQAQIDKLGKQLARNHDKLKILAGG